MDVYTFLKISLAKDFKLLAGQSGLNNKITGVNILDNPRAMDWLSPGELIVTSGYFFKDSIEVMTQFIESFARMNIAAICIKPQIYFMPLPQELKILCDKLSLPLIEIPYGIAFSKIMITVMNLLSDSSNETVNMVLDLNSQFMEYSLEGEGIDYLRSKLEDLLQKKIIITNADWSIRSRPESPEFDIYLEKHQDLTYFNKEAIKDIPVNLNLLKHTVNVVFSDLATGILHTIYFNEVTYGYIIVLQADQPFSLIDYSLLDRASITIALEIVHQTEKDRIVNRLSRDFYRNILAGNKSLEDLQSQDIVFDYSIPYSVFIISIEFKMNESVDLMQQKFDEDFVLRNFLSYANQFRHPLYQDIHLFKQGKQLIGLVGEGTYEEPPEAVKRGEFFKKYINYLRTFRTSTIEIEIFVGSKQVIEKLNTSFQQASKMIQFNIKNETGLYFTENYHFEFFLYNHIENKEALNFSYYNLQPLIEYDELNKGSLLESLDIYLQNHLNIAAASRILLIHRNTLLYRIDKIQTLLNMDLDDPTNFLKLSLALKFINDLDDPNDDKILK